MEERNDSTVTLQSLTLHGLLYIYNTKNNAVKLFWSIVLIGSLIGLVAVISQIILGFLVTPTATSVDIILVPSFAVPPLFICPPSVLNLSMLKRDRFLLIC